MLLNHTNHPSSAWPPEQLKAAREQFGEIVDEPFPSIDPEWDEEAVVALVKEKVEEFIAKYGKEITVHIMGEATYCFAFVSEMTRRGVACVASTTVREVSFEDGIKKSRFRFKRFRYYLFEE